MQPSPSDEMIYHVTHDLRAPLRAMKVIPEWIAEDLAAAGQQIPPSVTEHLDSLTEQATMLDQMILDLREYSRIGRCADPVSTVSLASVVQDVAASLPEQPALALKLTFEVPAIHAPLNETQALFQALLSNAVRHHDAATARVEVTSALSGKTLLISVADDGPGIAPDLRERALAPMTTLYRREDGAGTGVGLALARRIVTNLGGEIVLAGPDRGRGLLVNITLPAACATKNPDDTFLRTA